MSNVDRVDSRPTAGNKVPVRRYQIMRHRHPAFMEAVERLGAAANEAGPLDDRTKELIQLGAAAALRAEGAVHSHARRALQAGASADEVRHSLLLLVSTIGFPTVAAAMSWVDDVIEGPRSSRFRDREAPRDDFGKTAGNNPASADGGIHY
jgi:AhpD family alkylhydroperoxidase